MGAQVFMLLPENSTPIDEVPGNFNPMTCPIIARHIFGLRPTVANFPRKRAAGPLPLGPGEMAGARELRKRGLHLRIVKT